MCNLDTNLSLELALLSLLVKLEKEKGKFWYSANELRKMLIKAEDKYIGEYNLFEFQKLLLGLTEDNTLYASDKLNPMFTLGKL